MAEKEKYIGEAKMREKPKKALKFLIGEKAIKTKHLDDACVTPDKLDESVGKLWLNPALDEMFNERIRPLVEKLEKSDMSLDEKYTSITNELYSLVASLQVGGIAISQQFGNRADIGISQRILTKAVGKLWDVIGEIQGKEYMDYTLTVQPTALYTEGASNVSLKADCSGSISDFDSIKVYVNGVLKAESRDITVYETTLEITEDSLIRVEGIILGKPIIKEQSVNKLYPFFMGSGLAYTDIMNAECQKEMHGSLEGDYDIVVRNTNDYIFIIIPISHKEEFRRAKLDMNGFEIPLEVSETPDYIICQTLNRYQAGEYNIDIDINS